MATAYLRAAHAYMLISMPTGTSTIFGVFQAILALLLKPDELRPGDKLIPFKKFASEIFWPCLPPVYVASQRELTLLCALLSNQSRINGFRVVVSVPDADFVTTSLCEFRIKFL
jgi:hypothetical protein